MLWTDGFFVTIDDLKRIDSEIVDVAGAEGITLTGNHGAIRGAIEETCLELQKMLTAFGGSLFVGGEVSSNHMAAVNYTGARSSVRAKALPSQVVVSGSDEYNWNCVKHWVVHWCLHFIYRDAYNRTVKDRYESRMRNFKSELVRRLTPALNLGIPLILNPLARPAAIFEREVGTWGDSNVSGVSSSGESAGNYDVAVTYVDMTDSTRYVSASSPNNCESHPSERANVTVTADQAISVSIASLTPRTTQHPATQLLAIVVPRQATHWNVYVGSTGGTMYLQNANPIAIATKSYTLSGDPTLSGYAVGVGQYEDRRLSIVPMRQRA